ncbi:MAG: hypothetical protein JWR69_2520 [Pedosphaera sp.]|nr:hypothetical protein [Pedosphaera sp.]
MVAFRIALLLGIMLGVKAFGVERSAYWDVDANGLWTDSYRWSTPSFPANQGTNLYSATIDMPSRTVTLDQNVTVESFALSRGVLAGSNSPTLMLNQQLHLGAAGLSGNGFLSANGMTITTNSAKSLRGWTVENRGVGNWLSGDLHVGEGFRFVNASSAGFNANFDGTIVNDIGGTALVENAGMFRKSAGTNQTKIYVPFLNRGTVEVDFGELAFYGNSTNLGGRVRAENGASVQFTGLRHTFDTASTLEGDGAVDFDNGVVDFDGVANVKGAVTLRLATVNITPACTVTQLGGSLMLAASGTLNLNSGETVNWNSLTLSNGVLNGTDTVHAGNGGFLWAGGTLKGAGSLVLDTGGSFVGSIKTLRGWTVENHGALHWNGGDVTGGDGSHFINAAGASLETAFDGNWYIGYSGGWYLNNYGVIQKSGGTNLTTFAATLWNEGLIEAAVGAIRFTGPVTNKGGLHMAAGTSLIFSSANHQLTGLGSLDGDGSVVLENGVLEDSGAFRAAEGVTLKGGTLRFTNTTSVPNLGALVRINGAGTLDLSSGQTIGIPQLLHTNGTITGSDTLIVSNQWVCANGDLDGPGRLELRGASVVNGGPRWTGRRVVNYGGMEWVGGDIDAGLGLVLYNAASGVIYVACDRNFTTSYGGNTTVLNEGTFRKDGGSGTNLLNLPFINNNGQVFVNSGRLQFNGGFTQTNGLLALNGTAVGSGKPLLILGGTLAGSGDIFGSVFNADTMTPGWGGQIGTLNISGNCTQAVSATLQIELGGSNQFDRLAITGQATLNGKLAISRLNNFTPPEGSTFPILTCGTRTGQFSQLTGADLPGGLKLVPVYSAGGVSLLVSNTLPPLQLSIESLTETNAVKVTWPAGYDGYTLQTCTNLTAPDWSELSETGPGYAIIPATAPSQSFRLKKAQ